MKKIILALLCTNLLLAAVVDENFYKPIDKPKHLINTTNKESASMLFGVDAGSLGGGFSISLKLSDYMQTRYNYNSLSFSKNGVYDAKKLPYFARTNLYNQGFIIDYFPFKDLSLHLSTGLYKNKNRVDSKILPKENVVKIGDKKYTFDLLQKVNTKVKFRNVSPYIGLGLGGKIDKVGIGWSLDAGVLFHGQPKVDMSPIYGIDAQNSPNIQEAINQEVEKEKYKLTQKIRKYKYYPVVKFGLNYSF